MTLTWMDGEPIVVTLDAAGKPMHFIWEEQRHVVHQVVQRWELETEWWRPDPIRRLYLAVFTDRKMLCVICHDLLRGEWRLIRLYD